MGGNNLNHYEIEASVIRAKNGNREELLKILEQYKPFILKTSKDFNIKNHDTYDLMQIGYVALINAVAKYKPGSNTFSSYAFSTIKNALRFTGRSNAKINAELSLNSPINYDGDTDVELIDCIGSPEDLEENLIRTEKIKEVRRAVSKLPADEMALIIMVYYSKCSLKTYAEKKGISYPQAVRKKNQVLQKLSKYVR